MSRILIAGNWKMHLNVSQASILVHRLQERIKTHRDVEVALFPSMLAMQPLSMQIDRRKFRLGAQDGHFKDEGAYTGEVSISMLRELVHYVLVGHSERRHIFGESDETIGHKVAAAVRNDISPILCVGETKDERSSKLTSQILHNQVTAGLKNVTSREIKHIVIAYEPVWAIGTGDIAKPDQIASAVATIRSNVAHLYGVAPSKRIRVLYGGSVNADVARAYLEIDGVDGVLVGGASLNYHSFSSIVGSAYRLTRER